MQRRDALRLIAGVPVAAIASALPAPVCAQVTRGFDQTLLAIANGAEIQRQPDLWVFEVSFKNMRMVQVDVTDPKTHQTSRDRIWYLPYRAVNRPLATRQEDSNTTPVNVLDPLPGRTQFMPELTLMTYDDRDSKIPNIVALDVVIPEAAAAINRVERRRADDPVFQNTVGIVQPLPDPVPITDEPSNMIYGVATWRNIDPDTDFFSVVMRGFSNGYELREGPDGQPLIWRKSIVQNFTRLGDRFDPNQKEFALDGPPQWVYLPDPPSPAAPAVPAKPAAESL